MNWEKLNNGIKKCFKMSWRITKWHVKYPWVALVTWAIIIVILTSHLSFIGNQLRGPISGIMALCAIIGAAKYLTVGGGKKK